MHKILLTALLCMGPVLRMKILTQHQQFARMHLVPLMIYTSDAKMEHVDLVSKILRLTNTRVIVPAISAAA